MPSRILCSQQQRASACEHAENRHRRPSSTGAAALNERRRPGGGSPLAFSPTTERQYRVTLEVAGLLAGESDEGADPARRAEGLGADLDAVSKKIRPGTPPSRSRQKALLARRARPARRAHGSVRVRPPPAAAQPIVVGDVGVLPCRAGSAPGSSEGAPSRSTLCGRRPAPRPRSGGIPLSAIWRPLRGSRGQAPTTHSSGGPGRRGRPTW